MKTVKVELSKILDTPVVYWSKKEKRNFEDGQMLHLRDVFEYQNYRKDPRFDDFSPVDQKAKLGLPCVTFESKAVKGGSDAEGIFNGLVFCDVDFLKECHKAAVIEDDLFKDSTDKVLTALKNLNGFVASWQSSGCGIHAVFALDPSCKDSRCPTLWLKYLSQIVVSTIPDEVTRALDEAIKADPSLVKIKKELGVDMHFKSVKQLAFFPNRKIYITKHEAITCPSFDDDDFSELEEAKPAKPLFPERKVVEDADTSLWDERLMLWAEKCAKKILNPDESHNKTFMQVVKDFGRYLQGSGDYFSSKAKVEVEQLFMKAAFDSDGHFGLTDEELSERSRPYIRRKREKAIFDRYTRHLNDGLEKSEPLFFEVYAQASSSDENMYLKPGDFNPEEYTDKKESAMPETQLSIFDDSPKTAETKVVQFPKAETAEKPEVSLIPRTAECHIDLSDKKILWHQPEETTVWPKADAQKLMIDAFLKHYRIVADNSDRVLDLETADVWSVSKSKRLLNSLKWKCIDTYFSPGRKPKEIPREFSFMEAAASLDTDSYYVALTRSYSKKPKSLCMAVAQVTQNFTQPCYNFREPLALEGEDLEATPDKKSKEFVWATKMMDLIKSRFNQGDDPTRCCAFYCKYICDMVLNPDTPPKTCLGFFNFDGGTGKSTLGYFVPTFLLGSAHSDCTKLEDRQFADGYEQGLLVHFSEITDSSDDLIDMMKRLVDTRQVKVEYKGKDKIKIRNCLRVTAASNFPERFKLKDQHDRRWTIFNLPYKLTQQEYETQQKIEKLSEADLEEQQRFEERWGIDSKKLRLYLFILMKNFYRDFEIENEEEFGPRGIDLGISMATKAKTDVVSSVWGNSSKIVQLALELLSDPSGSYSEYKADGTEIKIDITKERSLFKVIKNRGEGISLRDCRWTAKTIKDTLTKSGLFETRLDRDGCRIWSISANGLSLVDDETKELYLNNQKFDEIMANIKFDMGESK